MFQLYYDNVTKSNTEEINITKTLMPEHQCFLFIDVVDQYIQLMGKDK